MDRYPAKMRNVTRVRHVYLRTHTRRMCASMRQKIKRRKTVYQNGSTRKIFILKRHSNLQSSVKKQTMKRYVKKRKHQWRRQNISIKIYEFNLDILSDEETHEKTKLEHERWNRENSVYNETDTITFNNTKNRHLPSSLVEFALSIDSHHKENVRNKNKPW